MVAVDKISVGATFISEYYHTFCTKPAGLAKMYTPAADLRHSEGRDGIAKGSNAATVLAKMYPGENRGKIVVKEMEILPATSGSAVSTISIRVRGTFTLTATQEIQNFTQVFEIAEHGESHCFGITSDVMSWNTVDPAASASVVGVAGDKKLPPPPTLTAGDWAMETPPLFARPNPKAEISPMDKPLTATTAAPLASLEDKKADTPAKAEAIPTKKDVIVADKKVEAKKDETPKKEVVVAEEKVEVVATESSKTAEEQIEIDTSKMSMLERIRYKQNLAPKPIEEKKVVEKKEEKVEKTAEEKKRDGDRRREAGERRKTEDGEGRRDRRREGGERKEGAERKEGGDRRRSDRKDGEKKEGEKKASTGEKKETSAKPSSGDKAANVVYYDLILKGLPKGTTVEDLYALLEPLVAVQKPIKLEARPDKTDSNTIRTFAFVVLNKKNKTADEALPVLKRAKLALGGTNVIVDRVREKFDK